MGKPVDRLEPRLRLVPPGLFPVGRVQRLLRKGNRVGVSAGAPVYVAAVLEYLTAEILDTLDSNVKSTRTV